VSAITYAKAGETPANWAELQVIDLATGQEVRTVVEIDTEAGWLVRGRRDADGRLIDDGDEFAKERIEGRFALVERAR
jgi:hypothetical protein